MSFVRIVSLTALVGVIIYVAVSLKTNPELSSSDNIVKLVSSNPIIAVLQFVLLYMLKGISMVFPSAVLNIATGMVFDFPFSALISGLGILVEYVMMYVVGRFLGIDIVEGLKQKYLFNPLSWQLWAVVVIRGAVIAMTIIIRTYASKKINKR